MNINRERLWMRLETIASIGRTEKGGISRFAWTPTYKKAATELIRMMQSEGLTVRVDSVGNVYGRYEGKDDKQIILTGSHLDTVPEGGMFDGIAGIMSALEVISTLRDNKIRLKRPVEIIAFINEEASQFLGGTFGSKAICGFLEDDYPHTTMNRFTGQSLKDAMTEYNMGLEPDCIKKCKIDPNKYLCFIEVHIEQGKYLLDNDLPLGVITDIAGIKQFYITLHGISCHAGGMAMKDRHDTLAAAAAIACEVENLAKTLSPNTRGTVGYIDSKPAEHNIVAGVSIVPVDYREVDNYLWEEFYERLIVFTRKQCKERGLTYSIKTTIDSKPAHCNNKIQDVIRKSAKKRKISYTDMISYPCHDAVNIERILPIGMIFLRSSNNGLSHCKEEYTSPEDMEAGTNVLLDTIIDLSEKGLA